MKNKPIKIIDRNFNFIGEIDDYEALIFTRSWSGIGSFELHINANKNNTNQLQNENIIFLDGNKAGVILHREISTDNSEQLVVKGNTLKTYISRMITIPPTGQAYDYKNDYAENIMKYYVDKNCVNPQDIKRKINKLAIAPNQNRGSNIKYQTRLKNLAEEIAKISQVSGLGWDIYLDLNNKQFIFEVLEGRNITSSQDILPPAIFSIDYDNISSQRLIDSKVNYRNVAYVGGQGEGVNRAIDVIGDEAEGLDRHEVFIDARDIEDDTRLADRGLQKLKEYDEIITFDNDILTQSNLVYEKDFDLGDIVTAVNRKWNITLDSRITEVTEIYEADGFKINAVFGNNIPTLIDKIKQELDGPLIERTNIANLDIPTKTSQLENDAGYVTKEEVLQASTYTHNQISPISTWTITHNLSRFPSVTIVDSGGNVVNGDIQYISENQIKISFSAAFAGKAYIN